MSSGSSPRARGTRQHGAAGALGARFIPAGAGNTLEAPLQFGQRAVHPRGRGEHMSIGSAEPITVRFIPAGAGNTRSAPITATSLPVHPRGRGEHQFGHRDGHASPGSSPRARGTRDLFHYRLRVAGFIPAGAGNTRAGRVVGRTPLVHPRGRGEHRDHRTAEVSAGRFIPAGAGNTSVTPAPSSTDSVHPRGRGEHRGHHLRPARDRGSSPRARGTQGGSLRGQRRERFIPAGAGNTGRRPTQEFSFPVHPRGRGEHHTIPLQASAMAGSSPRARGTLAMAQHVRAFHRFIPAGAGNTRPLPPARTTRPVHPRGRGEHIPHAGRLELGRGSSPRARGTP